MKQIKTLLCFFISFIFYTHIFSQQSFDSSYAEAVTVYKNIAGINTHLYNGTEYKDYDHRIQGNPFFADTYFTEGSILYDDILYNNIQLLYDVVHDNVIIKNFNDTPLVLIKEKIAAFNLTGHHFININADNIATFAKASGFYEVLYDGNTKLLAKRQKFYKEKISVQFSEFSFNKKDEYYILKTDALYAVNDKNSVLAVLKDKKNDVVKFLHQSKIKFQNDAEAALIKIVSYYDEINTEK